MGRNLLPNDFGDLMDLHRLVELSSEWSRLQARRRVVSRCKECLFLELKPFPVCSLRHRANLHSLGVKLVQLEAHQQNSGHFTPVLIWCICHTDWLGREPFLLGAWHSLLELWRRIDHSIDLRKIFLRIPPSWEEYLFGPRLGWPRRWFCHRKIW